MADLYDRLFEVTDDTSIAIHEFYSALVDVAAGESTPSELITYWAMDTEAQADLSALVAHYQGLPDAVTKHLWLQELHSVMMLANADIKYKNKSQFKTRLGF